MLIFTHRLTASTEIVKDIPKKVVHKVEVNFKSDAEQDRYNSLQDSSLEAYKVCYW